MNFSTTLISLTAPTPQQIPPNLLQLDSMFETICGYNFNTWHFPYGSWVTNFFVCIHNTFSTSEKSGNTFIQKYRTHLSYFRRMIISFSSTAPIQRSCACRPAMRSLFILMLTHPKSIVYRICVSDKSALWGVNVSLITQWTDLIFIHAPPVKYHPWEIGGPFWTCQDELMATKRLI